MTTVPDPTNSPALPSDPTQDPALTPPTPETPPAPSPEPVAPLTAESIKFAEGFNVDEAVRDNFLALMNDDKLAPTERAQKLIDLQQEFFTKQEAATTELWEKQQNEWQEEVRNDPEVGGTNFDATFSGIAKVVEEYGSPELKNILDVTGAGNNIHVVKFMNKLAKALNEGGGHVNGDPPPEQRTTAQKLFPSMK